MKNQLIIKRLSELGIGCRKMDFKGWKRHPWVILQLGWNMVIHRDETLTLSTSAQNVYGMMKLMKKIGWKQNTIHWVIGGTLGQKVQQGIYRADVIGYMKHTLVESPMMAEQLKAAGIKGVLEVPNFKPVIFYPELNEKYPASGEVLKFVFLSRIMPEKGCDYILEAAKMLNEEGLGDKYRVDFYGKIADEYKDSFMKRVYKTDNVNYCGFLNLENKSGYDKLSSYDVMLLPTYWKGEGFAGVFIDAFIAGLPIITTDWAHNRSFLSENETAVFVPVHDVVALKDKMEACIDGIYDLNGMAKKSRMQAEQYNINNVITRELLEEVGVV